MRRANTRRWTLAAMVAGIAAAFTPRGEAQHPVVVDVEATPYLGRTSGRLPPGGVCGYSPSVGTAFAGLGARVSVRRVDDARDRSSGFVVAAQGAVERQSNALLDPGSDGERSIPPDQNMAAGSVTLGWDGYYAGVHGGVGAREVYADPTPPTGATACSRCVVDPPYDRTRVSIYPDLTIRLGRTVGFHVTLNTGAHSPALLLRPGGYLGVGYTTAAGHDLAARCGLQSAVRADFPFSFARRCELAGAIPLGGRVGLGLGVGVVDANARIDYDARASITFAFGR